MDKMRIAYCLPSLYISGGMERVLTMKANFLVRNGYEIHIIITDGGDKPFYFPLDSLVKVHQLDIDFEDAHRHSLIWGVGLYLCKMRSFRKKLDVCLNQIKPDITISLLRRDINIINKMTDGSIKVGEVHLDRLHFRYFHAPWMPRMLHSYIRRCWMNDLIRKLKKLSKFVVLTYEDAAFWPELNNVAVIPNPVSFFPDTVSDCTQKQVIAAGRYVGQKGFDRLITAWQIVAQRHPDWTLKIYGDGCLREQLQRQIDESGLTGNCFLEHTVKDIAAKFRESAIFVLSSRFEGFGLVIVEAMACGLPAVSFTCRCGPRDIISDGIDGLWVEDGDVNGLAEKICMLIEDEGLRQEMGERARLKAESYKIEHIGELWIKLFESLIDCNSVKK